jgi:hypothetical protein
MSGVLSESWNDLQKPAGFPESEVHIQVPLFRAGEAGRDAGSKVFLGQFDLAFGPCFPNFVPLTDI